MARSSSSAKLAQPDAKRLGGLQATGKHTKTAAIQILLQLQASGRLEGDDTARTLRKHMQTATEAHGQALIGIIQYTCFFLLDNISYKHDVHQNQEV